MIIWIRNQLRKIKKASANDSEYTLSQRSLDTEQKDICFKVALGLCQIALDDPDMVYEIGLGVSKLEEMENGKADIINLNDWRKKLN